MSGIKLGQSTLGGLGGNFSNTAEPAPSFNLNLNTGLGNLSGITNAPKIDTSGLQLQTNEISSMLQGEARVSVVRGSFMLAPGVKPAVNRPLQVSANDSSLMGSINNLADMMQMGANVPERRIRELGAQLINCTTEHEGYIAIPMGWNQRRLRFMLVFRVDAADTIYQTITGYTDYDDPAIVNGVEAGVDPNMRLYFNNVMRFKPIRERNEFGAETERLTIMSSHQIMTMRDGQQGFNLGSFDQPTPKELITPTTMFHRLDYQLSDTMQHGRPMDSRCRIGAMGGVTMSNRSNMLGSSFFANSIKALNNAATEMSMNARGSMNMTSRNLVRGAANHVHMQETNAVEDKVINMLRQMTGYASTGSVTWAEFVQVFPEAAQTCQVMRHKDMQESYNYHSNDIFNLNNAAAANSEEWGTGHFTTVKAQQLLTTVPSLMNDCLLTSLTFSVTNMTVGLIDPLEFKPTAGASFLGNGVDLKPFVELFFSEYRTRIHPILSDGDTKHYTLTCHCDLMGEMRVTIYYDGLGESYNYSAGTYCDHLFTPNQSANAATLENVAIDFGSIASNLMKL